MVFHWKCKRVFNFKSVKIEGNYLKLSARGNLGVLVSVVTVN